MTATSIEIFNLLLYISMICWLWFLLILWTYKSSCQQHDWNHTLISLLSTITCLSICLSFCDFYISLFLWNSISISQFLITFIYDYLFVCLFCNFYISLFSQNLTLISHFHWLSSIERVSSISHSISCTMCVRI